MGASSSISSFNEVEKKELIENLKLTYENYKNSSNDDLYNAYQQILLNNTKDIKKLDIVQVIETTEKTIVEISKEKDQRLLRNKEFIKYCGYVKGNDINTTLKKLQSLFDQGVDVDSVDDDDWTALFYACGEGNLKIVEWLTGLVEEDRSDFEKGAGSNINYRNKENLTPLWIACNNGRRDVVQFLLSIGADDTIIGQPLGEPKQSCSNTARRSNHPGIADLIDVERAMRDATMGDIGIIRYTKQLNRQMNMEEFRETTRLYHNSLKKE